MHPIIMQIGPFTVYSWGFMVAIAVFTCYLITRYYSRREDIDPALLTDLFVYIVIASLIGARSFYVIAFLDQFKTDPISVLYVQQGGLAFLGGFTGAFIAIIMFAKRYKMDIWKILDVISPGTMMGYAIGRVGCLLNGCCYGIYAFGFQQPTQVYSSFAGLTIFFVLMIIYKRKKFNGQIFLSAAILYCIYRFFLEFLRYMPYRVVGLTLSQILLALIFIISSYILWKKNTI